MVLYLVNYTFGQKFIRTLDKLTQYIESLIFVADSPITVKDIKESLKQSIKLKASNDEVMESIATLQKRFKKKQYSFELVGISDGYQFMTKADYHEVVGTYLRIQSKKKLSRASMETLAIIAYKQPMTKSGIESIRGVNCDYAVQKLVEKELVEILGRADTPGRPILYGTSDKFMDYFGIKDITDLPKLKEIIVSENANSIGMEEGLNKMHTEGLTEDFQFLPPAIEENAEEAEAVAEENSEVVGEENANAIVDQEVEVTQAIETSDVVELENEVATEDITEAIITEEIELKQTTDVEVLKAESPIIPPEATEVYDAEVENNNQENRNEQEEESVNSEEN